MTNQAQLSLNTIRDSSRNFHSQRLLVILLTLLIYSAQTNSYAQIKWNPVKDLKKQGGNLAHESKKGIRQAGQVLGKPFRHLGENTKEAVFFEMRNHVVNKNKGNGGTCFLSGTKYHRYIQPHMPRGMNFSKIIWHFNAYVPSRQTGITFGNHVYINWKFNQFHPQYLALMAHETGHVIQYQRWGTKGFARKYVNDAFGSWTKYPNFNQVKIHDDMAIEREAEQFAQRVMDGYRVNRQPPRNPNNPQAPAFSGNNHPQQQPQGQQNNNSIGPSDGEKIAGVILQGLGQAIERRRRIAQERPVRPQAPNQNVIRQPKLGLNVQSVPGRGAFVTSLSAGKPGQRAGIEVNDYVVKIDGRRVYSASDVLSVLRDVASTGRRTVGVLVENHRLSHLPIDQRYTIVNVSW